MWLYLRSRYMPLVLVVVALAFAGLTNSIRQASAECLRYDGKPCRYDPNKEDPPYQAEDDRINPYDPIAPMTAYCRANHSLDVFGIYDSKGVFLFNVSAQRLSIAMAQATRYGKDVLIQEKQGSQLWALKSGQFELHNYNGYDFLFAANTCGPLDLNVAVSAPRSGGVTVNTQQQSSTAPTKSKPVAPFKGTSVATGYLSIRTLPSEQSTLLGFVPRGATITVMARDTTWYWANISYNGMVGWVSAYFAGLSYNDLKQLPVMG